MDMYIRAEDLDEETLLELDELGYGKTYKVASRLAKEVISLYGVENTIFIFKPHATIDYTSCLLFHYTYHLEDNPTDRLISIDELRDKLGLKPRKYLPHMLR